MIRTSKTLVLRWLATLGTILTIGAMACVNPALANPGASPLSGPDNEAVRGVVISTHGIGHDWGRDVIVPAFEAVKAVGANWVSTHPYARIREDGYVDSKRYGSSEETVPEHWVRPIREAHRLKMKIFIKPHLAYWGSRFDWRGSIRFEREEEWARFFREYGAWILALAEACHDADAFCVGTELDLTLHREAEWRSLIEKVRERTSAPLTYAANWSEYQRVPFWDALDVIGIQAYFPLAEVPDPPESTIRDGWDQRMRELNKYGVENNRNIVFTEIGYCQSRFTAVRPWEGKVEGAEAFPTMERCLRIALEVAEREPRVVGLFLWKWFPPPRPVGRNYRLALPEVKRVISSVWVTDRQPSSPSRSGSPNR